MNEINLFKIFLMKEIACKITICPSLAYRHISNFVATPDGKEAFKIYQQSKFKRLHKKNYRHIGEFIIKYFEQLNPIVEQNTE